MQREVAFIESRFISEHQVTLLIKSEFYLFYTPPDLIALLMAELSKQRRKYGLRKL
jgi:hypothetical protein